MKGVKIAVKSYAGYKGEELPRSFIVDGCSIEVIQVASMWTEEDWRDRRNRRFFRLQGSDAHTYILYYENESMEWFLVGAKK